MRKKRANRAKLMMLARADDTGYYYPSQAELRRVIKLLDEQIFTGRLQKFRKVQFRHKRNVWGECQGFIDQTCSLYLSPYFRSQAHFIETVAHECVHAVEWRERGFMNHGRSFFAWRKRLSKLGIRLVKKS